jgi:anti-sigma regulatory factor (Ser/Thr protein kinase)
MCPAPAASSLAQTMTESLELELPRDRGAARLARQLLAERFGTSLTAEELDTVWLLVSELVNNAVLHGQGQITMKAEADGRQVRVDVIDDGTGFERRVRHTGFDALGGRGLQIVEAESSRWGISEGTTHVWFELERHGPRLGPQ